MQSLFVCKPTTKLGRWAVGPLMLSCVGLSCLTSQAQQQSSTGEWKAFYQWKEGHSSGKFGARIRDNSNPQTPGSFNWNYKTKKWDLDPHEGQAYANDQFFTENGFYSYSESDSSGSSFARAIGMAGFAETDGQMQITWKWVHKQGYADAGQVPSKLNFVVRANAVATANNRVDSDPVMMATRDLSKESGDASVSLGDGGSVKDPVTSYESQWTAKGTKFYSIDTNGSNEINVDPITLHAKGSVAENRSLALPPRYDQGGRLVTPYKDDIGEVSANFSLSAELNDHWVSITSPTIETSFYKGSVPAVPIPHNTDSNGEKNTDSVVDFSNGLWQTPALQFNANLAGDWNSAYFNWSSAGDEGPAMGFDLPNINEQYGSTMSTAFNLGPDINSFPKSSSVKVTATGTDGSIADNSFNVKWHLQYEKSRDLPDGAKHKEISWVGQDHIPTAGGVGVKTIPAKALDSQAFINSVSLLAELGEVPGASEIGKIFELVTGLSEWKTTEPSFEVDTSNYKNDAPTFRQVLLDNPDNIDDMTVARRDYLIGKTNDELQQLLGNYTCFVGRVRLHKQKNYLADKYDSHGYVGWDNIFHYDYTYPNGKEFQLFYRYGEQSPPPGEGDTEIPPSYNIS